MSLTRGEKLGPYEILSAIGAGGMGEVYRARDTRLGRDVAIKVLPASFSADPDRLARFEQEARAASQLNHPNIVTVHDFGTHAGAPYVVQELLEGETLGSRLKEGPLPARKATEFAVQIVQGLAAAHEKGIVHRDLKPENLFLTSDGRVKILDFGLAKLLTPEPEAGGLTAALTATRPGIVMGTLGYMSPEQVRAQAVDARSDIFSFGVILYEMVAGQRAFERATAAETMAAILKEEPPDIAALGKNIPPALERVVAHCLEKNPDLRFQSAKDLAFALSALSGSGASTSASLAPAPVNKPRKPSRLAWAVAAVVGAAGVLLALLLFLRPSTPAERMQFDIPVQAEVGNLALSADGRMLAFVARDEASGENMLYFERVGAPSANLLPGTEDASYPFWSPDDLYLGFFANGKLKKIAVSGSAPQVLAAASYGRGGSWSSRGVILYTPDAGGPIWRVNDDGTNAAPLTDKVRLSTETSHRWPCFLPDSDHFLFWSGSFGSDRQDQTNGIYISSLAAKKKTLLVSAPSNPGYANGHLYYVDDRRSLMAVPLDIRREAATGASVVVSDRVTYQPSVFWGAYGVGGNDIVIYTTSTGATLSVLAWCDRTGKELGRLGEPGVMANPSISPDGRYTSLDVADLKGNYVEVWIVDLVQGTRSRFTFDRAEEATGVWSRDGKLLAYRSIASGASILSIKPATGVQAPKSAYTTPNGDDIMPNSWAADDKLVLCSYQPAAGGSHLVVMDLAAGKLTPLIATKASETDGQISPDGKWVAYASNESGEWEIYVTTFPGAEGKWQVSRGGGTEPRWSADGKEIFFIDPRGMLTAVPVNAKETFSPGAPTPLFQTHRRASISSTDFFTYDAAKDGKRFLVNRYVKPDHVQPLTVVLNAAAGMKK